MPLLGVLLLIPDYPYFIAVMYAFISIPVTFVVCKDQKDIYFSVLLPVRKKDVVKARFVSVVAIELWLSCFWTKCIGHPFSRA